MAMPTKTEINRGSANDLTRWIAEYVYGYTDLVTRHGTELKALPPLNKGKKGIRVAVPEWHDPIFVIGLIQHLARNGGNITIYYASGDFTCVVGLPKSQFKATDQNFNLAICRLVLLVELYGTKEVEAKATVKPSKRGRPKKIEIADDSSAASGISAKVVKPPDEGSSATEN